MVYPEMSAGKKRALLLAMWDNLGRTAAELPHLPNQRLHQRVIIHGMDNLPQGHRPLIFFSGHVGNWELTYPIAHRRGIRTTLVYRHANNPIVDRIISDIRATQSAAMLPKGPDGAIRLLRALKDGTSIAMLVDQKMNDGIAVPFFGRPAMTAPAIAEIALRFNMPVVPARIVRTRGCNFEAFIYPELPIERTGDRERDALAYMTKINLMLEGWIREHPEQWFWVHRRWPKDAA